MKPLQPASEEKLDELAEGLDAGWDLPEQSPPISLTPSSAPLPPELAELDADWDTAVPPKAAAPAPAARAAQPRASAVRPSQARPNQNRAVTPPVVPGAVPVRVSKKDRREAERKRRAHEAQQKSVKKTERKAQRRAEALRANEQARAAEEQARAARLTREQESASARASKPKPKQRERSSSPKRVPKRVRHEHVRSARTLPTEPLEKSSPVPIVPVESWPKRLLIPLLIAILVAVTLGFALSRAR